MVSIIIVSYHTGPALWLCIDSALMQAQCSEILLVNNGNEAGVLKRLETLAAREPRFKLISGQGNVGFGRGCNLGASHATGDYVLMLNPDSMLEENALAAMLEELSPYPENTLAGCYLQNPGGSEQRGGRRSILTPKNAIAESFKLEKLLGIQDKLNLDSTPMPERTHEVPVISGAFMFLSRAFYQQLGGFDEGYFLHMEDTDFCYRVHQCGGKVICVPNVKTLHFRSTSEVASAFVEKHKTRGFIRYLQKYFSATHSPLFMRMLTGGIWLRYYLKLAFSVVDRVFVPPLEGKQEVARLVLLHRLTRQQKPEFLAQKMFIVTGSGSESGIAIIGNLLAGGAKVIALHRRGEPAFTHERLVWVKCDLASSAAPELLRGIKVDGLIHAAPVTLLPPLMPVLLESGITRFIVLSTIAVNDTPFVTREKEPLTACAEAEQNLLKEAQAQVTLIRTSLVYGGGFDSPLSAIAAAIRRFGKMVVYKEGSGLRNPVSCKGVAASVMAVLDNPATFGKIYEIGSKGSITYREMIEEIAAYSGKPVTFLSLSFLPSLTALLKKLALVKQLDQESIFRMNRNLVADNSAAIADFGYNPSPFLEEEAIL